LPKGRSSNYKRRFIGSKYLTNTTGKKTIAEDNPLSNLPAPEELSTTIGKAFLDAVAKKAEKNQTQPREREM